MYTESSYENCFFFRQPFKNCWNFNDTYAQTDYSLKLQVPDTKNQLISTSTNYTYFFNKLTQKTITSTSAIARLAINRLVTVLIRGTVSLKH